MFSKCMKCNTNCLHDYCPPCKMVMKLLNVVPLTTYDDVAESIEGYYGSASFIKVDEDCSLLLIAIPLGDDPLRHVKYKLSKLHKSELDDEVQAILNKI